jgi:deoxyribodipyrimidine photolyase-related protein
VLGDQLDLDAAAFDGFDPAQDAVWMAEVAEESTHVWSSKPRTRCSWRRCATSPQALRAAGRPLHYTALDDAGNRGSLAAQLHAAMSACARSGLVMTAPGDWRVLQALRGVAQARPAAGAARRPPLLQHRARLRRPCRGRKQLRMEFFYREMRRATAC